MIFDQSLMPSSHQSKKRTTVEDNVSEDGNLQFHEEIIDTIIGERQSRQNSDPGISSKLAAVIKMFWKEASRNNSLFKGYRDQLTLPENFEYIKVPLLNDDILKKKTYITITKEIIINIQICRSFSHKLVLL